MHGPEGNAVRSSDQGRLLRLLTSCRKWRAGRPADPRASLHAIKERNPARPVVTAAIVVKNGVRHLQDALESVKRQTRPPDEILCIVGDSADGTRDLLRRHPGLRVVDQSGSGLAAARNLAIAKAMGSHIAFLDHDDLWLPQKLEAQLRALECLDHPGISITGMRFFTDFAGVDSDEMPRRPSATRLGTTPSALLADRRVFEQVGGFDERMSFGCDGDWFVRALDGATPVSVVSQAMLLKRLRRDSLSGDPRRNRTEAFEIIANRRRRGPPR